MKGGEARGGEDMEGEGMGREGEGREGREREKGKGWNKNPPSDRSGYGPKYAKLK